MHRSYPTVNRIDYFAKGIPPNRYPFMFATSQKTHTNSCPVNRSDRLAHSLQISRYLTVATLSVVEHLADDLSHIIQTPACRSEALL